MLNQTTVAKPTFLLVFHFKNHLSTQFLHQIHPTPNHEGALADSNVTYITEIRINVVKTFGSQSKQELVFKTHPITVLITEASMHILFTGILNQ